MSCTFDDNTLSHVIDETSASSLQKRTRGGMAVLKHHAGLIADLCAMASGCCATRIIVTLFILRAACCLPCKREVSAPNSPYCRVLHARPRHHAMTIPVHVVANSVLQHKHISVDCLTPGNMFVQMRVASDSPVHNAA